MEAMKAEIQEALVKVIAPRALALEERSSPVRELEGLARYVEPAFGEVPDFVEVPEGGVNFRVSLAAGQKTGWYFDQTANRAMLARHVRDARVLDVFSYGGGCGLRGAAAGAREVICVDSSETALAGVHERRAPTSFLQGAHRAGDAFECSNRCRQERERFDVVIVDPPAFVKRKKDLAEGRTAYRRINQIAMQLLTATGC